MGRQYRIAQCMQATQSTHLRLPDGSKLEVVEGRGGHEVVQLVGVGLGYEPAKGGAEGQDHPQHEQSLTPACRPVAPYSYFLTLRGP